MLHTTKQLLGIKIDYIQLYQAIEVVQKWMQSRGKHYITTPNPEMLVDAGFDEDFKSALNRADLAIPDSVRLGWGSYLTQKNPFTRLIYAPFFIFPRLLPRFSFPVVSGVDLMESLLSLSEEKAYTTAFLGGSPKVADKLLKCLKQKYPKLKIVFCSGNVQVNNDGDMEFDTENNKMTQSNRIKGNSALLKYSVIPARELESSGIKAPGSRVTPGMTAKRNDKFNAHLLNEKIDIMFVAFGARKQEKWMQRNLPKLNTRVMMGVGGAFDYLSGSIPRAPILLRQLGLEWLFRLIVQPWRIKRFWKLFYFVYKLILP
jgi:N-acetylglucosaminyldiphosphoundecaprenol N-acetyl-beta-D-mannosaminyltransferase